MEIIETQDKISNIQNEVSETRKTLSKTSNKLYAHIDYIYKKFNKLEYETIKDIQDDLRQLNKETSFLYLVVIFLLIINFILICVVF